MKKDKLFINLTSLLIILGFTFLESTYSQALLETATRNRMIGTSPYLTIDSGKTKIFNNSDLLSIKLSDGKVYNKLNNKSTPNDSIELPASGQSIANVITVVPIEIESISTTDPTQKVDLQKLIAAPYNYGRDDDGDTNLSANGSVTLTITDINGNKVSRKEVLNACNAPYKLTLNNTDSKINTVYGLPNNTNFTADTVTYYLKSKTSGPYACYAKPNLTNNYGSQAEWNGAKGFKLQSISNPAKNFPRTGFDGAFFDLSIAGASAKNIIDTMGTTVSAKSGSANIKLILTAAPNGMDVNVLRIKLSGPNSTNKASFTSPTVFELKSGNTLIYNFAISKWFIARPNVKNYGQDNQSYCRALGNGYRVPSTRDLTNANSAYIGNLFPGWMSTTYARTIGNGASSILLPSQNDDKMGGLLAEWGNTDSSYYTSSEFSASGFYWTGDMYTLNFLTVKTDKGEIGIAGSNGFNSCVSP